MNILQNMSFCAKGKMLKQCSEQREGDLMMTVYIFGLNIPLSFSLFAVFISPFYFFAERFKRKLPLQVVSVLPVFDFTALGFIFYCQ